MIEFDEIFCQDLKDDFEEIGRGERNFTLKEFLRDDLSRAFAFGFSHLEWKEKDKMWFPVPLRKELRHLSDGMEHYSAQLEWLNKKYRITGKKVKIKDYAQFILDNVFCDDPDELLKIAIIIGTNLGIQQGRKDEE